MSIYNIPCTWRVKAEITVEAMTREEAIRIATEDADLPIVDQMDMIPDTFRVDHDDITLCMTWRDVQKETILALMDEIGGDGWTIYKTEWFVEKMEIPHELILQSERIEKSDGTAKGNITDPEGNLVDEMRGVHSLSLHYKIAHDLGVDTYTELQGRGFQAQHLCQMIREHLVPGWKAAVKVSDDSGEATQGDAASTEM